MEDKILEEMYEMNEYYKEFCYYNETSDCVDFF